MSRANEASEPSMEDILASIRRIISDDDQHAAPQAKEEHGSGGLPAGDVRLIRPNTPSPAQTLNGLPEEEVFDLTDELVFADQQEPQEQVSSEETQRLLIQVPRARLERPAWIFRTLTRTIACRGFLLFRLQIPTLVRDPSGHAGDAPVRQQSPRGETRQEFSQGRLSGGTPCLVTPRTACVSGINSPASCGTDRGRRPGICRRYATAICKGTGSTT